MNLDFKNFSVKVYSNSSNCIEEVITPVQVHGSNFVEIINGKENLENCDALMTFDKKFKLGMKTADCAAICFGDGKKIGIIHVGWRGLILGICEKVEKLFNKDDLEIFVGPFLTKFEIKKDFCFEQISAKFGDKFFIYDKDRIIFDFKSALESILPMNTVFDSRDTELDLTLPSNRRDATKQRLLTLISFK